MKKLIILLISTAILATVYLSFTNLDFSEGETKSPLEISKPFSGKIDLDYLKQMFEASSSQSTQ